MSASLHCFTHLHFNLSAGCTHHLTCYRQSNCEGTAVSVALTHGRHSATMQLHQMAHDCETQAETAVRSRNRRVSLSKALKNMGQKFAADTDTCITHHQLKI